MKLPLPTSSLQYSRGDETCTQQLENSSVKMKYGLRITVKVCFVICVYDCGLELGQRGRRDWVDGKGFQRIDLEG